MNDNQHRIRPAGRGPDRAFHAKAMQASPKCQLVAVADMDRARLEKLAGEFGCRGYSSLDEMLADPAIQVINVLTPNHLHSRRGGGRRARRQARAGGEAAGHVAARSGRDDRGVRSRPA